MATDTTTNHTDATNAASSIHESDVEQAHLTQAGAPVQVQVPQGENVVRVQVTPGETVELPFPTDGLVARLGDNGNLAVKVGDITVILVGYADATGQGEVTILGNDGKSVDVAAVLASTDPNLDIQTAAGPGAGDQGTGADNNGGLFAPFDPNAGIGGLNAIGGLDPTALQYGLLQREFVEIIEADEVDTVPTVVNITQARPVNEDDFHGHRYDDLIDRLNPQDEPSEQPSARQSLQGEGQHEPKWVLGNTYDDGNDPFDTKDHEEGSQTDFNPNWGVPGQSDLYPFISDDNNGPFPGGIDMDREPLSVTAVVEANFFSDLPGKLVLDANGDGTGDVPLITELEGMNLTSHGHELTFKLLPEIPESAPGANDGQGQMVIAYYTIIQHGCPVNVVVFSIGVDDDVVNAGETNPAGNAEFGITFSIYGVLDHPEKNVEDILNIKVPFFLDDSDSAPVPSDFPQDLVFQDIDDKPFLGEVCYVTVPCFGDIPIAIHQANLTIGHDETPGVQQTDYDTNGFYPGGHETTDDTGSPWPIWAADWKLDGIGHGHASGENVDIAYQQAILAKLAPEFLQNGNFCAEALGSAKTQITVSFGADGKAKGNDQAGDTLFQHDNAHGEGTDNSKSNFNSDGTPANNEDGGTDKRAFELFMHKDGDNTNPSIDAALTNWTITVNGQIVQVWAYQLDANTIIGLTTPPTSGGGEQALAAVSEGGSHCLDGSGTGIPVFMLTLDPNSGELTFVQYHQINNPLGGNAAPYDWDNSANDPINLLDADGKPLVYFQATDFDGDSVTAQLKVSVIDDAPDAKDDFAVLDENNKGVDGDYNKVTGNLVLGVSNDGHNNDTGKDKLSVDHDHTIPQLKYGNSTITFNFDADTVTVTGTDATNVTFNGHVVEFDTPHGHFKVVVDSDNSDPVAPGDTPLETDELGYYEYTAKPGNNSDKDHYGLDTTANGTADPVGNNDAEKIANILSKFNGITLTNNYDNNSSDAGDWGLKTIDAGGKHYTGIGVKAGLDSGETDTDGNGNVAVENITIGFPHDVDAAKITVGALFNGQLYDSGNAEALKWEAWDGNVKVGEGVVYGGYDGLVSFFINVGHDFDKVVLAPLDNGAGHNGNNSDFLLVGVTTCDELCVQEQLQYKLADVDGDYDTAKLTIDINDGVPCIAPRQADLEITIDEDGLPHGNNNNVNNTAGDGSDNVGGDNGPGDADGSEATAQGHIAYNTYADGLGTVFLSSTSALTTLDGKSLTWAWDPSLNRLVGYATPDTDRIVVEVLLSNANDTGVDFKIVLHEPLDHPQNSYEDNLYLDIKVTVTDKDCDIDTATIHVKIDDDVPTITAVPCSNLVTNGSFENVGQPDLGAGAWAVYSQIPGWKSGHEDNATRAGLEIQHNTVVGASDGHNYLELDSDNLNGQAPASTNAYVYQNVQGTENDASYILKFDYQPRVHDQGTHTNDVEVWWGGVKIGTLSGDGNGWTTYTFVVPGDAGQTRLEFRAAGNADSLGGFIDNVWVSSCEVVDEDDLNDGSDSSKESLTVHGSTGVSFGADGPGGFSGLSLTQPLKSHGVNITIVAGPDGTFYGMAGGTKVFTVEFTKTGGEFDGNYKFTLNNEIDHPGGNNGENLYDLGINFIAKDKDGDGVNGTIHVTVVDDVPEAHITNRNGDSVRIDETPGLQDDDKGGSAPSAFNSLGSVLVWGTSSSAAVSQDPDYNADNPGTKVLSLHVSAPGVDSGIDVIDAAGVTRNVVLTEENGLVVGRVEGGVDGGKVVFAVGLGQDGKLTVAEYMAIAHPLGGSNNPDDSVQIANGALIAKLTITDYDGDVSSDTVAIGNQVKFDDDAPSVGSNNEVWVEDDDLPNGVDNGPGDNNAPVNATGTLSHNYGTDGAGSTLLSGISLPGGQGFTSALSNGDKTLIVSQNGTPVLKIELTDATSGNYTVTQLAPIQHTHDNTNNGNYENETVFTVSYKVTDEDGDTQTGSLKINVDDDSPTAVDDGLYVVDHFNAPALSGNVLTNDAVGADQPGTVVGIRLGNENGSYVNVAGGGTDINIKADGTVGTPAIGTLHINPDGSWTFVQTTSSALPNLTFSYKMSDSDGDTDTASFSIDLKNAPPPSIGTQGQVLVDEDGVTGGANPNLTTAQGNGDEVGGKNSQSEAIWNDTLSGLNWNGNVGTATLSATLGDVANFKNLAGQPVDTITGNGTGTLILSAGGVQLVKIEITNSSTGAYTVTLLNPVQHSNSASEDNVTGSVKVTLTNIGGSVDATLPINIDDDRPALSLSTQGAPSLTVDETGIYGPAAVASVAGLFTGVNYGADGEKSGGGLAYKLTGAGGVNIADGTGTGLTDLNGNPIQLFNVGGAIQGKVVGGPNNGVIVFQVSISGSNVTLQQVWPIKHVAGNPDDALSATANLIYVTATATDKDGDTTSLTSSSALALTFKDDGPDAVNDTNAVVTIGTPITGNVTNNDSSGADVKTGFAKGEVTKFTIDGNDYAADGAAKVIPGHGTMSMDSHGNYSFTQTDGAAGTMNVTYTLRDGDGDTDTATLAISTVNDIAPINYNDANVGNENVKQDTNLMIILDISGSMGDDADSSTPGTQSRLDFCKSALIQLINAYDNLGDVKITIVSFTTGAQIELAWSSAAAAIAEINTFTPQDLTNYQAAVETADDAWVAAGKIPGAQNVVYFLSDGDPTTGGGSGNHLTQAQKDTWDAFLENPANGINHVYAVAVGDGINGDNNNPDSDLKDVADPDGNDSPDGQVIYVNNASDLANQLVGTITNQPIAGNVLDGSNTSGVGDNGSDPANTPDAAGNGTTFIDSFVYDGDAAHDVAFSWDGVGNITKVGTGVNVTIDNVTKTVSFDTENGTMTFHFTNGAYSFAPGSVSADTNVTFHYTTKDADGDHDAIGGADADNANSIPGGADLVITIKNVVLAPTITAVDDNVGSIQGNVVDGGVTDDQNLVLHGKAEAGATVHVYDGASLLGDTVANGSGDWTYVVPGSLANGSAHAFNATQTVGATTSLHSGNYDVTIDTTAPTVAINIVDSSLSDADTNSNVTITFSEAPVGFVVGDLVPVNGTISNLQMVDATHYTATFTKNAGVNGVGSVSIAAGAYTDAAGNSGSGGSDTVNISSNTNPVGGADFIITSNTGDVAVLDAWLLSNDTDAETPGSLTITDADTAAGYNTSDYDTVPAHTAGTVTFNLDTDTSHSVYVGNNESTGIHYDLSDGNGGTTSNVLATVTYQSGTTLTGGNNAEIIIGDGDGETLNGNGGNDILQGGGGTDTLNGGAGHDLLIWDSSDTFNGGADFDRVQLLTGGNTFTYDATGAGVKFSGIEMIDLGDNNDRNNSQNQVNINASDVLDTNVATIGGHQIDLFVIGDNNGGSANGRDNVDLTGFGAAPVGTGIAYVDPNTGISHVFDIYQGTGGNAGIKIAIEQNIDVS